MIDITLALGAALIHLPIREAPRLRPALAAQPSARGGAAQRRRALVQSRHLIAINVLTGKR